jgi:preprotein translocase subunit SecA
VEATETVSRMLKRSKIPHTVLNAKYHRQEAEIVASAGQRGAVVVSTNMAGRGTDIKLGPGVADVGGLFVIGTERYESRRVDRQLRGRCARQGDPGLSQFYISFEDDLMRNFAAADRMTAMMERFGMQEGEALEHAWLNKSVETAQKRVEQRNYTWRKRVLEFDDVMNKQREVVYGYRNEVLSTEQPRDLVNEIIEKVIPQKVEGFLADRDESNPDYNELIHWVNATLPIRFSPEDIDLANSSAEQIANFLIKRVKETYGLRVDGLPPEILEMEERRMMLAAIDRQWQAHLYNMDALREGVHLRAQGQKDPLVEYKVEAYELFSQLMSNIEQEALQNLFRSAGNLEAILRQLHSMPQQLQSSDQPQIGRSNMATTGSSGNVLIEESDGGEIKLNLPKRRPPSFDIDQMGRNAPCPCGSGKKYKQCCGKEG